MEEKCKITVIVENMKSSAKRVWNVSLKVEITVRMPSAKVVIEGKMPSSKVIIRKER